MASAVSASAAHMATQQQQQQFMMQQQQQQQRALASSATAIDSQAAKRPRTGAGSANEPAGANKLPVKSWDQIPLPNWSNEEIERRLKESQEHLQNWTALMDKTERLDRSQITKTDLQHHVFLKRKLHENLGQLTRILKKQIETSRARQMQMQTQAQAQQAHHMQAQAHAQAQYTQQNAQTQESAFLRPTPTPAAQNTYVQQSLPTHSQTSTHTTAGSIYMRPSQSAVGPSASTTQAAHTMYAAPSLPQQQQQQQRTSQYYTTQSAQYGHHTQQPSSQSQKYTMYGQSTAQSQQTYVPMYSTTPTQQTTPQSAHYVYPHGASSQALGVSSTPSIYMRPVVPQNAQSQESSASSSSTSSSAAASTGFVSVPNSQYYVPPQQNASAHASQGGTTQTQSKYSMYVPSAPQNAVPQQTQPYTSQQSIYMRPVAVDPSSRPHNTVSESAVSSMQSAMKFALFPPLAQQPTSAQNTQSQQGTQQ